MTYPRSHESKPASRSQGNSEVQILRCLPAMWTQTRVFFYMPRFLLSSVYSGIFEQFLIWPTFSHPVCWMKPRIFMLQLGLGP